MANDCLVKRLKGVVSNSTLTKYGYLPFNVTVPNGKSFYIGFRYNQIDVTDYIVDGTGNVTVTQDAGFTRLNFTPGTYKLEMNGKYNIAGVVVGSSPHAESAGYTAYAMIDLNDFVYSQLQDVRNIEVVGSLNGKNPLNSLTAFSIIGGSQFVDQNYPKLTGSLTDLARVFPNLDVCKLQDSANGLEGSISELRNLPLTNIVLSSISGSINISGALSDISNITSLTQISFHNTNVNGSIESFVEGQMSNERTSGSVEVDIRGGKYTLNNSPVNSSSDFGLTIAYTSNGATVSIGGTQAATYNKTSNTWSYN